MHIVSKFQIFIHMFTVVKRLKSCGGHVDEVWICAMSPRCGAGPQQMAALLASFLSLSRRYRFHHQTAAESKRNSDTDSLNGPKLPLVFRGSRNTQTPVGGEKMLPNSQWVQFPVHSVGSSGEGVPREALARIF